MMLFIVLIIVLLSIEYTCCSNEQLLFQRVVNDVLTNGEWRRHEERGYNYDIHTFNYSLNKLTQKEYYWSSGNCSQSVDNTGQLYKWHSTSDHALNAEFSISNIYKYLHGKQLLIVGDSLSDEFHMTLLHMLWHGNDNELPLHAVDWSITERRLNMTFENMTFTLTYVRSFHLLPTKSNDSSPINERPWLEYITPGTILILNKGAHFTSERTFIFQLRNTFNAIIARHRSMIFNQKNLLVIYRDTPLPLHDSYRFFNSTPRSYYHNMNINYTEQELEWGWDRFDKENHLSRKVINENYNWIVFMNISGSTKLRVDSRRDDMHFCIPGPVDHWVMKLVEILNIWNIYRHDKNVYKRSNEI